MEDDAAVPGRTGGDPAADPGRDKWDILAEAIQQLAATRGSDFTAILRLVEDLKADHARHIGDLDHRARNMLAVARSLVAQSLKTQKIPDQVIATIDGRLGALVAAHDLLNRAGAVPMTLFNVVQAAIAPHTAAHRFDIEGPDVPLPAKATITFTLALSELVTNAQRHGALSNASGRVAVRWSIDSGAPEPTLRFGWRESGGPPINAPVRRGFGVRMIERGLALELGGTATLAFDPQGLVMEMVAPLPQPGRGALHSAGR